MTPAFAASTPPQPFGPLPAERQLRWEETEFYGFIHFGLNTFTDSEWGYGDVSPNVFNPKAFNGKRIVQTMKEAGMKGVVLVCKHHDGFCLWPSRYTDYSVKASPWRGGDGDMVKETADACHEQGLKFGIYLSPWDRNREDFGRPEYIEYYRNQLSELLTNYGEVFMTWHDGAQGKGDGYYGGAKETRLIDRGKYYEWPKTWELVHKLQPDAVIRSDAGPDVRWIGNFLAAASDSCWCTVDLAHGYPGMPHREGNSTGLRSGTQWMPPECDISIRKGWFYHRREDSTVKTPQRLVEIYEGSVGRGGCLNLNVPLDQEGCIQEEDIKALLEFGKWLKGTFEKNLAMGARVMGTNCRGNDPRFAPEQLLDNDRRTYWATDDDVENADVVFDLPSPLTFDVIRLREYLPLGQRVDSFAIEQWQNNGWEPCAKGTSIGSQRIIQLPQSVTTSRVRLRILGAAACPALSEFGLYKSAYLASADPRKR